MFLKIKILFPWGVLIYLFPSLSTGIRYQLLVCFALGSNLKSIFSTKKLSADSIPCIHGMKVFSLLWIIMVHTYLQIFGISENKVTAPTGCNQTDNNNTNWWTISVHNHWRVAEKSLNKHSSIKSSEMLPTRSTHSSSWAGFWSPLCSYEAENLPTAWKWVDS